MTFPNGFALSIVEHDFSYGLEAALLKDGVIAYDNDQFCDVIGHLEVPELLELVQHVASLPADYQVRRSA
jgi:hypothetical protein